MLEQKEMYTFKDVATQLGLTARLLRIMAAEIHAKGGIPKEVAGIHQVFSIWLIRMRFFGPYYRCEILPKTVLHVDPSWSPEVILARKGWYKLAKVCRILGASSEKLRRTAQKMEGPAKTMGITRRGSMFLVRMEVFARWFKAARPSQWKRKKKR